MKPTNIIITFLVLTAAVTFWVARDRKGSHATPQNSGVVTFVGSGVSLEPGEGWQRIDIDPGLPVCPPTLVGPGGMVRVMLFEPSCKDLPQAVNSLRAMFDSNTEGTKDSFKPEEFRTETGLTGVRVSYSQRTQTNGTLTFMHSHNFVVTNRAGRCVSVSYLVTGEKDSVSVHQMITKTLKLE